LKEIVDIAFRIRPVVLTGNYEVQKCGPRVDLKFVCHKLLFSAYHAH